MYVPPLHQLSCFNKLEKWSEPVKQRSMPTGLNKIDVVAGTCDLTSYMKYNYPDNQEELYLFCNVLVLFFL